MKYFKKIIYIFLLFFILIPSFIAKSNYSYLDIELPSVQAKNILLYNLNDGKVLYEKNSEEKISIASLTKIMTALVAIEYFENLNEIVSVPSGAFYNLTGYAKAGFQENDEATIKDLLYATLLPSGAEAAQALAILTYGSFSSFVDQMNAFANRLGMKDTHYENPVGRDHEENYSTLSDLVKLLLYALKNPIFYEIYTTRHYITLNNLELESTLVFPALKYNLDIQNIQGSKSGYTRNAGLCLSSIAEFNGIKYLLITAGSNYEEGFPNHIVDSLTIYNYFFKNFGYQPILKKGEVLHTLEIIDGFSKTYEIKSDEDVSFYLNNESKVEYVYKGTDFLNFKIKPNDKLGEIELKFKDTTLYIYDVILREKIKYKHTKCILTGIFLILLAIGIIRKRKKKIYAKKVML